MKLSGLLHVPVCHALHHVADCKKIQYDVLVDVDIDTFFRVYYFKSWGTDTAALLRVKYQEVTRGS